LKEVKKNQITTYINSFSVKIILKISAKEKPAKIKKKSNKPNFFVGEPMGEKSVE
jgi:hypothetical protein